MKKGILALLCIMVASTLYAAPAFAADQKPIQVTIDDQPVEFTVPPVKANDTTLVPLRVIFEKLGLTVGWNEATQTITGRKKGISITLQIGSTNATVNGKPLKLLAAPVKMNDTTLVPIRFIGESTGAEVSWDEQAQKVSITRQETLIARETPAIMELYRQSAQYLNDENLEATLNLIHPQSPQYTASKVYYKEEFSKYDIKTEFEDVAVLSIHGNEANVQLIVTSNKINGPFYLDYHALISHELRKTSDGKWKIYDSHSLNTEYLIPADTFDKEPNVPVQEKEAILGAVKQQLDYVQKEDVEGTMSFLDKQDPTYEKNKAIYILLFKLYDLSISLDKISLVEATDNTAVVYTVTTARKVNGPAYADNTTETVHWMKKTEDGRWVFTNSVVINVTKLEQ